MSRNNKTARRLVAARALPKNRSAASRARRAEGKSASNGRTGKATTKKNAWWQKFPSYGAWIRGGKKPNQESM